MKRCKTKRVAKLKLVITLGLLVASLAAIALTGCNAVAYSTVIPAGHYEKTGADTIEFNHSRCGACHEGLSGMFSMSGTDLFSAHSSLWTLYNSGGNADELDEQTRQKLENNRDEMGKYFTIARGSSSCIQCHETGGERDGFKIAEFSGSDFCLECHDSSEIVAATVGWESESGANPHESHVDETDELTCSSCHQFHGVTSSLYCNQCHEFQLPESWISPMPAEEQPQ